MGGRNEIETVPSCEVLRQEGTNPGELPGGGETSTESQEWEEPP